MINAQAMLFIAQVSSALAVFVGMLTLISIIRAVQHLEKGPSVRRIVYSRGIFFSIALIGVTSMTIYHFLGSYEGTEELAENAELLWYVLLFAAIIYSVYISHLAMKFGKSVHEIETNIKRKFKAKKKR